MSGRRLALVAVVSAALLGGALLWSARLVEDVALAPPPPTATPGDEPRARLAPTLAVPPPITPAPNPSVAPPDLPADAPRPAPPPASPELLASPADAGIATNEPPEADDPFGAESAEIDYAVFMLFDADAGVEGARIAAETYERCLKQKPDDQRCYRGLVEAQRRLQPGWRPDEPLVVQPRTRDELFKRGPRTLRNELEPRLPATERPAPLTKP